ncbi:ECF transporter S component [Pseudogracilibacillus auburnensis]|uniref:Energy-coupling factor transport system substrate-specific component n=1 Tax=Pseudogracilibacillus auburnensis TaxID=1494959 RepID=A0A2V3VGR7_9BACI|nr:ECF transporter S component [Pseudogracilibacillus auburnensis]PXW80992.1 energy-coupling factor transport system substrate-specific component [Pseudogracilibacillus auburnensis]
MKKQWISYIVLLLFIPLTIWVGVSFFDDRGYVFISFVIVLFTLVPFFLTFEHRETNVRLLVVLAAMIALSVVGRFIFAALPGFKPVTAIVILTALYFGPEAGFLVGALTAIISNMYFGQGPWTPFQMFAWGIVGLLAGLPDIRTMLLKNKFVLILFGLLAGVFFSLLMDIWTVLSIDGVFNMKRYVAAVSLSIPFMLTYAVSNVVFLLLTIKPIGDKLERVKSKYGL